MKVLAFASYPIQAAATRYRLNQFVDSMSARGINLTIRPFIDQKLFATLYNRNRIVHNAAGVLKATLLRVRDLVAVRSADVVLVQREAMIFGPPIVEWFSCKFFKRPMVLDLDDATYIAYASPTYGSLGKALKWFSKTDDLIQWATVVTCGNNAIADYVRNKGARARIIPTVVDTNVFRPMKDKLRADEAVLGWIGTHSTFPFLESVFPVLQDLAGEFKFRLKIVGAGKSSVSIPGVEVENLEWSLERELQDFQSLDIGLYPIVPSPGIDEWAAGKSGFKAIQYMAVGIPYVASPVGVMKEIGHNGMTHFNASTPEEWRLALATLLTDYRKREEMGRAGRAHVVEHYGLESQADKLAESIREAATSASMQLKG